VRRSITGREDVRERGTVFLDEAEQHVAPLFDGAEPARVALDRRAVVTRGLRELLDMRERTVEQLLPLGHGRIETREAAEQFGRAREPRRVERLLELAGQAAELVGMGETLRLDLQGLRLPVPGRGALDFVDHMPEVIRLATYVLASGGELFLAPLELAQPFMRVAHRRALHRSVGVGIEHIALGVGPQ